MKKYLFTILLFACPLYSYASTFLIEAPKNAIVGDEVKINVFIDPEGQNINALSGVLNIDPTKAKVERVINGNSAVLFWVDGPTIQQKSNSVEFSGITPGGIESKSYILSVIVTLLSPGKILLSIQDPHILKNDGKGTEILVTPTTTQLDVLKGDSHARVVVDDTSKPEAFTLSINNSEDVFNNAQVVVFATQDKGVGVDHYEYASTWVLSPNNDDWKVVTSPAEIPSFDIYKKIYIKAIDREGNFEISTISAPKHYQLESLEAILSVLILCVLYFIRRFS